jgi:predicted Zn-dependent peptidase
MRVAPIEPRFVREGEAFAAKMMPFGELVVAPNPRNDLFTIAFGWDLGERTAPLLCHALAAWQRSGTAELDAAALQRRLFELGASVSIDCGTEAVRIELSGIDRRFEDSIALLRAWLTAPVLDAARVREVAGDAITARNVALDHDEIITAALRDFAYFGPESPELVLAGNRELLAADAKKLATLVAELPQLRRRVAYFGPRALADVAGLVAIGPGRRPAPARWVRRYRPRAGVEIHVVDRASVKANVHVLFTGPALAAARDATTSVVGREVGRRAWQELRTKRALAYSVRAGLDAGRAGDDAALWGAVQAQPDKVADAVAAMLAVLAAREPEAPALARAKAGMREQLRTERVDPRAVPGYVEAWRDRGHASDPRASAWTRLDGISLASATALLEALHGRPAIVTIVGDTRRIDMAALEKLGTVHVHAPRELFSFE